MVIVSEIINLVVRSGEDQKSVYPKRKTLNGININSGRDFHPLADHMTNL